MAHGRRVDDLPIPRLIATLTRCRTITVISPSQSSAVCVCGDLPQRRSSRMTSCCCTSISRYRIPFRRRCTRITVIACHGPRPGVRTPRAVSSRAIARVVMPASSARTGRSSSALARLLAIADAPDVQAAQLHTLRFPGPSTAFARAAMSLRSPRDGEGIHGRSRACPATRQGATREGATRQRRTRFRRGAMSLRPSRSAKAIRLHDDRSSAASWARHNRCTCSGSRADGDERSLVAENVARSHGPGESLVASFQVRQPDC
jgi:hypothetical protein